MHTRSPQDASSRLNSLTRRRYTNGPTPIHRLDRLSAHLGGPTIYLKRDDLTGLTGGGNKTRKLEFLVQGALAAGCDTLITTGAIQSNHCRLTLAAAAQEGMRCRLIIRRATPDQYCRGGNRLLFNLLGAEALSFVETEEDVARELQRVQSELAAEGRRGYWIPVGGSNALGTLGYAVCATEIVDQSAELSVDFDRVVCATGSCGTHAGLLAGFWASGADVRLTGINISRPAADRNPIIAQLAHEALQLLGFVPDLAADAVHTRNEWLGPGYAIPSEEMIQAVKLVARLEGILLDPVYSGKAMAGLLAMIVAGEFCRGQSVLFIHTGGSPALFAYGEIFGP